MKYGIVSLNIYEKDYNWGSVLQSWALQKAMDSIGIDNVIIKYKSNAIKYDTARYPILYNKLYYYDGIGYIKRFLKQLPFDIIDYKSYINRDNKFKKFINDNYRTTEEYRENNIGNAPVDGYVIGSDIVWNDDFWDGLDPVFFCCAEGMPEKYNISYAPSIKTGGFTSENEKKLSRVLNNFDYISIREHSKYEYIKNSQIKM